jgi:hypothetical protein
MKVVISWRNAPAWVHAFAEPGQRYHSITLEDRQDQFAKRLAQSRYYANTSAKHSTPLHHLFEMAPRFDLPKAEPLRPGFRSPIASEAITVVGAPLAGGGKVSVLPADKWQKLHLSKTRLLAATAPVLRQVVACVEARLMALPKLSDAIVVLNSVEHGLLHPGEKEMLWKTFGVPVYSQWLGLEGETLAWECEAHQGLHWNRQAMELEHEGGQFLVTSLLAKRRVTRRLETGWNGEIDSRPCPCGETAPRIRYLRNLSVAPDLEALHMAACA